MTNCRQCNGATSAAQHQFCDACHAAGARSWLMPASSPKAPIPAELRLAHPSRLPWLDRPTLRLDDVGRAVTVERVALGKAGKEDSSSARTDWNRDFVGGAS